MMVQYLLPPGFAASSSAGLLSALMGSLAGVFNACSTLFTVDLYREMETRRLRSASWCAPAGIATGVMVAGGARRGSR